MPEDPNPSSSREREHETGLDETFKQQAGLDSSLWSANKKWLFDDVAGDISSMRKILLLNTQHFANLAVRMATNGSTFDHAINEQIHRGSVNAHTSDHRINGQAERQADAAGDALINPIQQGAADNLTAGSVPANRAIDNATAAIATAVAKQVDATVAPVLLALQQSLQAVAAATASIANVLAQAQPKEAK